MLRIVCRAADAIDIWLMQGVDLVAALGLLMQEVRDQSELGDDAI